MPVPPCARAVAVFAKLACAYNTQARILTFAPHVTSIIDEETGVVDTPTFVGSKKRKRRGKPPCLLLHLFPRVAVGGAGQGFGQLALLDGEGDIAARSFEHAPHHIGCAA